MTEQGSRGALNRGTHSGWLVGLAWCVTFVLSYVGYGSYVGRLVEGIDLALLPRGALVLPTLALLVSLVLTVRWARGLGKARGGAAEARGAGRRRFLIGAAASLGGIVGGVAALLARNRGWLSVTAPNLWVAVPERSPDSRPAWQNSRVQEYRRLGRTNLHVSDISVGSNSLHPERGGEEIARAAIDRGVNYFDTAPDYVDAGSETSIGRAMKGRREKVVVATKFCTPDGHLPTGSSVRAYMEAVEGSLRRLQTDYVDLIHIHAVDRVERLLDPNVHEAFARLKDQGKARFLGFSSHTPNLERVANTAIDDGRFDVMLLAYHHGAWPNLARILDRAASQDIGIVAMKTLKGAKHRGLLEVRDEADSYPQAALKWVLNNPSVSCLVISFRQLQDVDEYLYASGKRPAQEDYALLEKYDRLMAGKHCFQHCGACLGACPEGLPIHDVLRHRMYFEDYRDEKEAMRLYAKLERRADACLGCSAPCAGACPHGVQIQERMRGAHKLLTLG